MYNYKRIDVPQMTLTDMPQVQIYVKTHFNSTEEAAEPLTLWRDAGGTHGSIVEDNGIVLYDEGCIYLYYKVFIDMGWPQTLYALTGDYKIVVIK